MYHTCIYIYTGDEACPPLYQDTDCGDSRLQRLTPETVCHRTTGDLPWRLNLSPLSCKKINRSHTHTPTENNTPDTDTDTHDKNNTPNPQTNTSSLRVKGLTPSLSVCVCVTCWSFSLVVCSSSATEFGGFAHLGLTRATGGGPPRLPGGFGDNWILC